MSRAILFSLRDYKGKPILDLKLGLGITHEDNLTLTVKLPTETVTFNKKDWVNKMRVFDNGNVWFIICTKVVAPAYVLDFLIQHTVKKLEETIYVLDHESTS